MVRLGTAPSRQQVLTLYKQILRYTQGMEFSSVEYCRTRMRKEFKKSASIETTAEASKHFSRGVSFMQKKMLL